jgi:hypothetical protein
LILISESPSNSINYGVIRRIRVEDKIDAGFQPNQFERYRARGEAGVSDGRWRQFELVLCAPRAYVDRKELETAKFDSRFPYEEIASFLKERVQGQRGAFLDQFFLSAAPRGASAYVKIKDAATDTFWNAAFELAHTEFPELEMKQPDLARGSAWVTFRPADFPSSIYIALKGPRGFADLTFGGTTLSELNKIVQAIEKAGTTLHQTGKSAAIRMTFSPFAVADGVEAVQTKVREALGCCRALVTLYRRHRAEFEADRLPTEAIDASSRFV